MPIYKIVQTDITEVVADALVNPTNTFLLAGGDQGVNGAIHKAAGEELLEAAKRIRIQLGEVPTGDAIATPAGNLKSKYVIHAVGPVYRDGKSGEAGLLATTYKSALRQADKKKVSSLAIPNISTGIYGFPKAEAADIVSDSLKDYFTENPSSGIEEVILVCRNQENFDLYQERFGNT